MASCVKSVHVGFSQIEDPKVLESVSKNTLSRETENRRGTEERLMGRAQAYDMGHEQGVSRGPVIEAPKGRNATSHLNCRQSSTEKMRSSPACEVVLKN